MFTTAFCIKSNNGPDHRHFNINLCGGATLDIGIYNIFLSLYLLGNPKEFSAIVGLNNQGCDTNSNYVFKYEHDTLAVMYSSFLAESPVFAEIHGTKGKIALEHMWFCPGLVKLTHNDGSEQTFDFEVKGTGYELEAEEVAQCILAGKTQSDLWSWSNSLELVNIMDSIRKECGIVYPAHNL